MARASKNVWRMRKIKRERTLYRQNSEMRQGMQYLQERANELTREAYGLRLTLLSILTQCGPQTITLGTVEQVRGNLQHLSYKVENGAPGEQVLSLVDDRENVPNGFSMQVFEDEDTGELQTVEDEGTVYNAHPDDLDRFHDEGNPNHETV